MPVSVQFEVPVLSSNVQPRADLADVEAVVRVAGEPESVGAAADGHAGQRGAGTGHQEGIIGAGENQAVPLVPVMLPALVIAVAPPSRKIPNDTGDRTIVHDCVARAADDQHADRCVASHNRAGADGDVDVAGTRNGTQAAVWLAWMVPAVTFTVIEFRQP